MSQQSRRPTDQSVDKSSQADDSATTHSNPPHTTANHKKSRQSIVAHHPPKKSKHLVDPSAVDEEVHTENEHEKAKRLEEHGKRVEHAFAQIRSRRLPLVCVFGLSHPSIKKQKSDLLETIAEHYGFVILDLDKIIGEWKDPIELPTDREATLEEIAREQGNLIIKKTDYKGDHVLTEEELCRVVKYALVAYHKKGKHEYSGYVLDSFPVNPTETHLLEAMLYPIALGFYLHPTHHESAVRLPENFRRPINYSEKLCRDVAGHRGKRVIEVLHPAALDHRKVVDDLIPIVTRIFEDYIKDIMDNDGRKSVLQEIAEKTKGGRKTVGRISIGRKSRLRLMEVSPTPSGHLKSMRVLKTQ